MTGNVSRISRLLFSILYCIVQIVVAHSPDNKKKNHNNINYYIIHRIFQLTHRAPKLRGGTISDTGVDLKVISDVKKLIGASSNYIHTEFNQNYGIIIFFKCVIPIFKYQTVPISNHFDLSLLAMLYA